MVILNESSSSMTVENHAVDSSHLSTGCRRDDGSVNGVVVVGENGDSNSLGVVVVEQFNDSARQTKNSGGVDQTNTTTNGRQYNGSDDSTTTTTNKTTTVVGNGSGRQGPRLVVATNNRRGVLAPQRAAAGRVVQVAPVQVPVDVGQDQEEKNDDEQVEPDEGVEAEVGEVSGDDVVAAVVGGVVHGGVGANSSLDESPIGDTNSPGSRSDSSGCKGSPLTENTPISVSFSSASTSSGSSSSQVDGELGNKCGKCQNHEIEISKKGHARDCPFKKCSCLKCRLLDARSDILQVISGKETKLKGTKKDPNCGFCQNHGEKILRKGHVRSCGYGQERHFKLDNCFDCEVHYIRNEVNRLQIKMRRAMKEDRTLSEEQRKTAREAITRDEVEKVCDMARLARKKRENILTQQAGETSSQSKQTSQHSSPSSSAMAIPVNGIKQEHNMATTRHHNTHHNNHNHQLKHELVAGQTGVWRPWSQHQVAAAMAAQQQHSLVNPIHHHQHINNNNSSRRQIQHQQSNNQPAGITIAHQHHHHHHHQQQTQHQRPPQQQTNDDQQLTGAITSMAVQAANQSYLINSLQAVEQQRRIIMHQQQQQHDEQLMTNNNNTINNNNNITIDSNTNGAHQSPPSSPPPLINNDQPLPLIQRNMQEQQLFNTLFGLIVAQFAQP